MKLCFRSLSKTTLLLGLCISMSSISCGTGNLDDNGVKLPDNMDKRIKFEDPLMEEVCVFVFDKDNDGKLSYAEAALVTDISLMKDAMNSDVTSFDEFQYFTNVKEIPEETFSSTSLSKITLPENLIAIRNRAFSGCKLTTITIPDKVLTMDSGVFEDCTELTSVSLPKNIKSLYTTFKGCTALKTVDIPESVTELIGTFSGCSNLESIVIPESVTTLRGGLFYGCTNLKSFNIPSMVTSLGEKMFYGCESLTSVEIPGNVKRLYYTFWECPNISEVIFHEGVEDVCGSFQAMNLTTVTLPSTIKNVGYAFCGNKNLKTVYSKAKSAPKYGDSKNTPYEYIENSCPPFVYIENEITVYVPAGSKEDYQTNWKWRDCAPIKIVEYDFENNKVI